MRGGKVAENFNQPIRVLLVEDYEPDAFLVRRLLGKWPGSRFAIRSAHSLEAALQALRSEKYDAVVLDLALPDSAGVATLASIAAFDPCLPIVVLTGYDQPGRQKQALEMGASAYLSKERIGAAELARAILDHLPQPDQTKQATA